MGSSGVRIGVLCALGALALALGAALPGSALAASLNFLEAGSSPEATGTGPNGVAAADLDGDGDADLAVVNTSSVNVTVLKNNGNGNFVQPVSSPVAVGGKPVAIVAADLDGDGDQDLAVANTETNDITVLKNHGNGSFFEGAASPVAAPTKPISVGVGDLDGDGDRDLAVAEQQSSSVRILLNKGRGNFIEATTSPEFTGQSFPEAIAVANIDGDGDLDLAVAHELTPNGLVVIFRNNGLADFKQTAASPEPAGNLPLAIASADFDLVDGPDLAVVNGLGGNVTILGNQGFGNFFEPLTSPETVGASPRGISSADFDGDGDPDLAVTNANGSSVTILKNR